MWWNTQHARLRSSDKSADHRSKCYLSSRSSVLHVLWCIPKCMSSVREPPKVRPGSCSQGLDRFPPPSWAVCKHITEHECLHQSCWNRINDETQTWEHFTLIHFIYVSPIFQLRCWRSCTKASSWGRTGRILQSKRVKSCKHPNSKILVFKLLKTSRNFQMFQSFWYKNIQLLWEISTTNIS